MCLLSLTNPNKKCSHSQCYPQNSNQFPSFSHLNQQGMPIFSYQNKKRPPIQSISETLAENLIKKLKDDKASTRATLEVDKGN